MITPDTPLELGLPAERWWPGQRDTIERVLDAFREYNYVLLNAPTGSGKTIVATAVQRLLGVTSVNLTHTIGLQDQYVKTMNWAQVVTGRNNHPCLVKDAFDREQTAEHAPCTDGVKCPLIGECSYYKTLYAAARSPQAVLNYAYAVRIVQADTIRGFEDNPFHRDLLVCDEADLAEQAIIDGVTVRLDRQRAARFECPSSRDVTTRALVTWAANALSRVEAWYNVVSEGALCSHKRTACKACEHRATQDAIREYRAAKALQRAVSALYYIGMDEADDWIVVHDPRAIYVRPIWGWTVARRSLFFAYRRALMMSATLGDPELLARKLDLPSGQWTYIEVPSYFPAENRPVFYVPVVKVNRNTDTHDFDKMARAIEHIAEQDGLKDKKGIVHTGSFRIAMELYLRLAQRSDRYLPHVGLQTQANRRVAKEQLIYALRNDHRPLIVLSPSLNTGVDIPYEIGFQVIAKVPFGDIGDPVTRARREYMKGGDPIGRRNYDSEALNSVIQACGRAVRAPDDKGVTYVIDGNFWPLYKRAHTPDHFKVQWVR